MRGLQKFIRSYIRQLWYIPLLTLSIGLMFARIILIAHLLPTKSFGYFSAGLLISATFGMLAGFGVVILLQREMPIMIIRNRLRTGLILLIQCIFLTGICFLVALAFILSGVQLFGLTNDLSLVALLHGFSQQLFLMATIESRSRGQSVRYAKQNIIRAIALLSIGAVVCYKTASPVYILLAETAVTLIIVKGVLRAVFKEISIKTMVLCLVAYKRLKYVRWKTSLILFVVSIVNYALVNVDKWIAVELQSKEKFALYAFIGMILTISQSIQAIVNASVYPLLARRYASFGLTNAYQLCCQISLGLLALSLLVGLPVYAVLNIGIRQWFSAYETGLNLIPIFLCVAMLRISDFWTSFMIIAGMETCLLLMNIAAIFGGSILWLYWQRPWQRSDINLIDIAFLALILTGSNYIFTVFAAWRSKLKKL